MAKNKFLKWSTWSMILNSRLIAYKNSKEPWCKERLKICNGCEFNSKNSDDLTFKEKFLMFIQLSKAICKICGCSTKYKVRIPYSTCSREELNMKPLWRAKEN